MLGKGIYDLRTAMGWNHVQLAEGLGIFEVTGIELGKRNVQPPIEMLVRLSKAFLICRPLPLRQSTRYNVPFSASRKIHQHLGLSSPHKDRSSLRGPLCALAMTGAVNTRLR